jgi:YbbR domain-containing protein
MKKEAEKNLYELHETENSGEYRVKESRFFDLAVKILAVVIAFAIWFYARATESPSYTQKFSAVPVKITGLADTGLSVISGGDYKIDITVQGKKSDISKMSPETIEAYVDVSDIKIANRYNLLIEVKLPDGVTLTEKSVNYASVYLDKTMTKTVPVVVVIKTYMLDKGYELGIATPNITEVMVEGTGLELDKIAAAQISLELGHITNSLTVSDTLSLVDSDGNVIASPSVKMQTNEAEVTVPVYITKEIPLEVSFKYGFFNERTADITITPRTLRIKGDPDIIGQMSRIIIATLNEKLIITDTLTQPIILPEGVINVYGYEKATVYIKHKGTVTKDIVVDNINVINPNGLDYDLIDDFITVKLRGLSEYIPFITESNVKATVDLSGFTNASGISSVAVNIEVLGTYGSYVYEVGEYRTSVEIY